MAYYYEKITNEKGKWYVHLLIPSKAELNDTFEYMTGGLQKAYNICLLLENARGAHLTPDYRIVTSRHQIDKRGDLFVSTAWNIRQQTSRVLSSRTALDTIAIRYATQYDFDKFCCDNPDERLSFDWNAEVYKVFISSAPGKYTPACQNESP